MAITEINTYPDLVSNYTQGSFDKGTSDLVNSFILKSSILNHANVMPCNLGDKHMMSILSGLPEAYFTKYYEGHKPSAANRMIVSEDTALLKSSSIIDVDFINAVCKNEAEADELCRREARYNHEAMINAITRNIFYGDKSKNDNEFTGLIPRFNQTTGSPSSTGVYPAGGGGSATTSMWIVTWGDSKTSLIHPQGTMGGITRKDHGVQKIKGKDGKTFMGRETEFTWQGGLAVADWRYVSRVCNISHATVTSYPGRVIKALLGAYYQHEGRLDPKGMADNTYIYCNASIKRMLDRDAINAFDGGDNRVRLKIGQQIGEYETTSYRGIPIVECPLLKFNEQAVI